MNKEEYFKILEETKEAINIADNKRSKARREYIEKNKPFNIGDRIQTKDGFGYVTGFELDFNLDVKIKAVKEKKDGTPSKITLYCWRYEKITLSPKG